MVVPPAFLRRRAPLRRVWPVSTRPRVAAPPRDRRTGGVEAAALVRNPATGSDAIAGRGLPAARDPVSSPRSARERRRRPRRPASTLAVRLRRRSGRHGAVERELGEAREERPRPGAQRASRPAIVALREAPIQAVEGRCCAASWAGRPARAPSRRRRPAPSGPRRSRRTPSPRTSDRGTPGRSSVPPRCIFWTCTPSSAGVDLAGASLETVRGGRHLRRRAEVTHGEEPRRRPVRDARADALQSAWEARGPRPRRRRAGARAAAPAGRPRRADPQRVEDAVAASRSSESDGGARRGRARVRRPVERRETHAHRPRARSPARGRLTLRREPGDGPARPDRIEEGVDAGGGQPLRGSPAAARGQLTHTGFSARVARSSP